MIRSRRQWEKGLAIESDALARSTFVGAVSALILGCGGDRGPQGAAAMTSVCEPLSQACYDGGAVCIENWASAQQPATWCAMLPSFSLIGIVSHCDGFNLAVVNIVDTVASYYYDSQNGALVGVSSGSKDGHSCFGQAPEVNYVVDCPDAGGSSPVSCESDGAVAD